MENTSLDDIPQWVINLDRRLDRWSVTYKILLQNGFKNIHRFSAVDAKKLSEDEIKSILTEEAYQQVLQPIRTQHWHLSRGAVGCFLSHATLWKKLASSSYPAFLIFEDDARPVSTFDKTKLLFADAPGDWDILLLGWIVPEHRQILPTETTESPNSFFSKPWIQLLGFWGLHGYIISRSCARKLLNRMLPMTAQVDSWISDLALSGYVKVYAANPPFVFQNKFNTDIQTPIRITKVIKPSIITTTIKQPIMVAKVTWHIEITCIIILTTLTYALLRWYKCPDAEVIMLFSTFSIICVLVVYQVMSTKENELRVVSDVTDV